MHCAHSAPSHEREGLHRPELSESTSAHLLTTGKQLSQDVDALARLRLVGLVEGVTLILLMFVAVPLKRMAGVTEATAVMGLVHGVVFIAYAVALIEVIVARQLRGADAWKAALACLLPFGTFVNDRRLRRMLARGT